VCFLAGCVFAILLMAAAAYIWVVRMSRDT